MIRNIFKVLFCTHEDLIFIRNIHGDEIYHKDARSEYFCTRCKSYVYKNEYIDTKDAKQKTHRWYSRKLNELYAKSKFNYQ